MSNFRKHTHTHRHRRTEFKHQNILDLLGDPRPSLLSMQTHAHVLSIILSVYVFDVLLVVTPEREF